jgi:hypothetical protein
VEEYPFPHWVKASLAQPHGVLSREAGYKFFELAFVHWRIALRNRSTLAAVVRLG